MDNVTLKHARDLCLLLRCALTDETADIADMDLQAVYKLAKCHSLAAAAFIAIENTDAESLLGKALFAAWRQEREMVVRKNIRLSAERLEIQRQLVAMDCWYLPLKGCVLADIYPKMGMRQMADNDILFDPAYQKQVRELFLKRGYECESYGKSHHDVYLKEPIYNFEMHTALFAESAAPEIEAYYRDIEKRLLHSGGMERKFTDEDFYIYLLAHGHKHFSGSGNGLRFLLDCYVYLEKYTLNREYIRTELPGLGLIEFECLVNSLSHKLFGVPAPLTEEEQQVFAYCVGSGTYGTMTNMVSKRLKKIQSENKRHTRLIYLLRRFWPEQEWFQRYVPFFAKWRILKPGYILWRFFRGLFKRRKQITQEVRLVSAINLEENGEGKEKY